MAFVQLIPASEKEFHLCVLKQNTQKKKLNGLNFPYHFTENLDYKGVELLVFMLGFTQNKTVFKTLPVT